MTSMHLVVALAWLTVAQSSTDLETFRKRGDAARAANRLEEAASVYREAVRLHPRWTEGHWYLGTISYELGNYAVCRTELQQVVRVQTRNGAAWAFKGLCELQLKAYATALSDLTRAEKLGVGEERDFVAVVGYHRALLLARDGQYERAIQAASGFVRSGNTSPEVLQALGISMLRLHLLPSELSPEQKDLVHLAGRAGALALMRRNDQAAEAFEHLLSRYPDASNVHYLYGTFLRSERPSEALEQFKIELAHSPMHVLARVEIAQELLKEGNVAAARPYAEEAARLAPTHFVARRVLGEIRLHEGDLPGAIVELEAAVKLEPQSPSCHFTLAKAYVRAGRDADARRERAEFTRLQEIQQNQRGAVTGAAGEESGEQPPH